MVRRILPPDDVVLELARSGMHPKDIRARYGGGDVLQVLRKTEEGRRLIRELDSQRKKTPLKWKGSDLERLVRVYRDLKCLSKTAKALGTNKATVRRGLHLAGERVLPQSEAQAGKNNPYWNGGKSVNKDRVYLLRPNHPHATQGGYVLRSRLRMEKHLGRYLRPEEVVHHKDDDPTNDRLSNLQLFASNAEHLRETLKGKCPEWSEDGKQRIREACSRPKSEAHKAKMRGRKMSAESKQKLSQAKKGKPGHPHTEESKAKIREAHRRRREARRECIEDPSTPDVGV